MNIRQVALLTVTAFLLTANYPVAQEAADCAKSHAALALLANKFQEHPVARGLSSTGKLIVITATVDGSTWTALAISPQDIACKSASGIAWAMDVPQPPVEHASITADDILQLQMAVRAERDGMQRDRQAERQDLVKKIDEFDHVIKMQQSEMLDSWRGLSGGHR